MRHSWKMKLGAVLLVAALLSACSAKSDTTGDTAGDGGSAATATATAGASDAAANAQLASIDTSQEVEYEADDAYTDWTTANPTKIALSGTGATIDGSGAEAKDGTVTITAAGTYAVSGKLDDGRIVVDVADKGVVRLVLNGAEIHNSDSSAIYVEEAGKLVLTLAEGTENVVSDGAEYVFPDASTDEPNAAIFSHDDLTINGSGKLAVQGNYKDAIKSKDDLKITGGTIAIQSVDDGLVGRDLVAVQDGAVTIDAADDAVKTTNDTDETKGFIYIQGGTFSIQAGDDAIHSETAIKISGGKIDILKSNEGIEARVIDISGGDIRVVSDDDGVNAAGGTSSEAEGGAGGGGGRPGSQADSGNLLKISGGTLSVDAQGDGLDANGSIEMSGGTVLVNGPTNDGNGSLDYDGTFVMTGGFLVAAGSSGMAQASSDGSTQPGILMTYSQTQQAGAIVRLEDADGNGLVTFAPSKTYSSVFISSPELKQNASYTLYSGGTSTGTATGGLYEGGDYSGGTKVVSFETSSVVTWLNESGVTEARSGMGGPGGNRGGGGRGFGGGRMPQGGQQPPDGQQPTDGQLPADGQQPTDG